MGLFKKKSKANDAATVEQNNDVSDQGEAQDPNRLKNFSSESGNGGGGGNKSSKRRGSILGRAGKSLLGSGSGGSSNHKLDRKGSGVSSGGGGVDGPKLSKSASASSNHSNHNGVAQAVVATSTSGNSIHEDDKTAEEQHQQRSPRRDRHDQQEVEEVDDDDEDEATPTMSMVPTLIIDLQTAADNAAAAASSTNNTTNTPPPTSNERAARALRHLFALSEHSHELSHSNRENLVHNVSSPDGKLRLIPTLLHFLKQCPRGSHEQYLALLVLNNVSIPAENKRVIGIDCGGASILSRLLVRDPSCHLLVIVLVNLTFADSELRRELVNPASSVQLVDALAYAFRVAILSPEEANTVPLPHVTSSSDVVAEDDGEGGGGGGPSPSSSGASNKSQKSPRQYLATLAALSAAGGDGLSSPKQQSEQSQSSQPPFDPTRLVYPETGRWCLCALKNLTRPSRDPTAAHAVMDAGIIPQILGIVTIHGDGSGGGNNDDNENDGKDNVVVENNHAGGGSNRGGLGSAALNAPSGWEANSMQDAALFTLINLSATPDSRSYLRDEDGVRILAQIADFGHDDAAHHDGDGGGGGSSDDTRLQQDFQCLKARMALAYLVGGEGHFGQPRVRGTSSTGGGTGQSTIGGGGEHESVLRITETEAKAFVQLLADTLHHRAKDGPGGYSAATFTAKGILHAIRCLLTQPGNQSLFASSSAASMDNDGGGSHTTSGGGALKLNSLLLKSLARHAVQQDMIIDADAAEHASWSLYLMSNLGFDRWFLPAVFDERGESIAEKVFTSYLHIDTVSSAGRHAVDQLLLRLKYLKFEGSIDGERSQDYEFDRSLLDATNDIIVESRAPGAKPNEHILGRPILRSRGPKRGEQEVPWENMDKVTEFPSVLYAVQQLSYGSTKVRHMDAIDDVLIANNIASSANGMKTESYNYWWSWKDTAPLIKRNISSSRRSSKLIGTNNNGNSRGVENNNSGSGNKGNNKSGLKGAINKRLDSDEPFSIFGIKCVALGCSDTTR